MGNCSCLKRALLVIYKWLVMKRFLYVVGLVWLLACGINAQTVVSQITGMTHIRTSNGVELGYMVFGLSDGNQRVVFGMTNRSGGDAKWYVDLFYSDDNGATHRKHADYQGPNRAHFDKEFDVAQFLSIKIDDR